MARDLFHYIVRSALEKDELLAAEKGTEKIEVEIKNFVSASKISEFHTALGQFINYRTALRLEDPGRILYLAVPSAIYSDFLALHNRNMN